MINNLEKWKDFKENGLLWLTNNFLHLFGYTIIYEIQDGEIINIYPSRTNFRGFSEKSNSSGFKKVHKYLKENIEEIYKETCED